MSIVTIFSTCYPQRILTLPNFGLFAGVADGIL